MDLRKYDIKYDESILRWDEGLPLGNGKMGCLIYGDGPLRLSIDRMDLWDTRPHPTTLEKDFCFKRMKELVADGSAEAWEEYHRLFDRPFSELAYPSKITAGRIELDFSKKFNAQSRVSIKAAVADVSLDNGETGKLQSFLCANRPVGVAKIYGDFTLNIHIPNYISGDENGKCKNLSGIGEERDNACMQYPHAQVVTDGDFYYFEQSTHTEYKYGLVVMRLKKGDFDELYYTVATTDDRQDFIAYAKELLRATATVGYETLKKEHEAWWKKYWTKSEIRIGDPLLEKVYYRAWYLFASASRKGSLPYPAQGVWTADNDSLPPWKGDYHHDTNTEVDYQPYLKANRLDEGKVYVDYLWNLRGTFRKFAKDFFGVKGLLLPSASTIDGKAMGGWAQYALSPTMTIWAAQSFDEYYLYTGDMKFLKTRAYPYFKEIGQAISGLLEEKDGKLYMPLSSSPEIFDNDPESYLPPNSNFDLALLIYLYRTLKRYTEILGLDGSVYEETLSKLDDIAVEDGKFIMLDKTKRLHESHRHLSHLMCLYPLHVINYDTPENKRIYECSLLELEQLGMGWWVGFSYGMCAQIYAMAEMGNAAYEKLYQFAKGFVAENGFHLNGDYKKYGYTTFHYRPFTNEAQFGFCDALQEMLMQEHQGYIHLFPALPMDWKDREVSFKKLRSYGGVLVSAKAKKNTLVSAEFSSLRPMNVLVKNVFDKGTVYVEQNGKTQAVQTDENGMIALALVKGKTKLYVK